VPPFIKPALKTFLGISSFQALAMFRRGLFYAYLSIFLRHFLGLSVTETTLFATVPMVFNILSQTLIWGRLSDKYQLRRTLIITGESLAAVGTVLIWYAYRAAGTPKLSGVAIIAGLGFIEIFWSMSNIGWSALISDIYPQHERTEVQGRLTSIGGLGRMAGVWIGGLLYDGLGLKYAGWGFDQGALWFVAAGVMLISIIPMAFVPEGGAGEPSPSPEASTETDPGGGYRNAFALFILAMVFINFGRNSIAVILTQYLVLDSGIAASSHEVSYIVNTQSLAMILTGLGNNGGHCPPSDPGVHPELGSGLCQQPAQGILGCHRDGRLLQPRLPADPAGAARAAVRLVQRHLFPQLGGCGHPHCRTDGGFPDGLGQDASLRLPNVLSVGRPHHPGGIFHASGPPCQNGHAEIGRRPWTVGFAGGSKKIMPRSAVFCYNLPHGKGYAPQCAGRGNGGKSGTASPGTPPPQSSLLCTG
jgi:hypothetical protein